MMLEALEPTEEPGWVLRSARRAARPSILRIWSAVMPPEPNRSSNLAGLVRASTMILITALSTSCAGSRQLCAGSPR